MEEHSNISWGIMNFPEPQNGRLVYGLLTQPSQLPLSALWFGFVSQFHFLTHWVPPHFSLKTSIKLILIDGV